MKTAVVAPSRAIYSETFIRAHVEHLPGKVDFLSGGGDTFPLHGPEGTRLFRKPGRAFRRVLVSVLGANREDLQSAALARVLKRRAYDVVLAEYGPVGASVADACHRARIPIVVHFHGYDAFMRPVLERYAEAYRTMFTTAAAVVAVSSEMVRQLQALGAPPETLHHLVYGVDTERFAGATPAAAGPVFIAVGRLVEKKAPHLTVTAFREVLDLEPNARLVVAGDGPLLEPCRQLVRALGLELAVSFPGVLAPEGVADLMRRARAFVQHSVVAANGDREGTPLAVLEAMSSGLPVVSTKHGGILDVVVHGETGLLVGEYDVAGMADSMLRLARDAGLAASMGVEGRRRVISRCTIKASIDRLAEILASAACLGSGGR